MKYIWLIILAVLLGAVAIYVAEAPKADSPVPNPDTQATSTVISYPLITKVKLYENKDVGLDTTIEPWAVLEDSRCPIDVQCVWAGRVQVGLYVNTPSGKSQKVLEPMQFVTTETLKITLLEVAPAQKQGHKITDEEYLFIFKIEKHNPAVVNPDPAPIVPKPIVKKTCYVGGCSSQICSDKQGMVSTCEWTERYACYQNAKCELQTNGECGWTETTELKACISAAQ